MFFSSAFLAPLKAATRPLRKRYRKHKSAQLFARIGPDDTVLEIGPFTRPQVRGPNVRYFDVLDREALIARAKRVGYPVGTPVDIDFVSPEADLSIVTGEYDYVISSHCIEHQPDLVAHLQKVGRLLKRGGAYLAMIPDKRYCFDHFLPASSVDAVLEAHREGRTRHTLENVLNHRARTTHNDADRHWAGDHGKPRSLAEFQAIEAETIAEFEAKKGEYIDTHAWQFTPQSFKSIIDELHRSGLSPLQTVSIAETAKNTFEFGAVLGKLTD